MTFYLTIFLINLIFTQIVPFDEPLFIKSKKILDDQIIQIKESENIKIKINGFTTHQIIALDSKDLYYVNIKSTTNIQDYNIFIIDIETSSFNGPYNNKIKTLDPLNTKKIMFEIRCNYIKDKNQTISLSIEKHINENEKYKNDINYNKRFDNPTILVTGYWPPTNEMIRHFSQDSNLNPDGWIGENWENTGYDIVSYFPTFDDPDCSSCGQGNGILQVDYQNTSEDFWPIVNNHKPIAIITFSRGYINYSWELENNYYNRTNWYNDYESPFLPTPNPPDSDESTNFLRNSNLPMNNIINSINDLDIGLDPYIDINGDPGKFVSEFMGYHGVWYRDLNLFNEFKCISAGHVHVGGQIDVETAKIAANETIRTLIQHLDESTYIPGDSNSDDIVDVLDLIQVINHILGNIQLQSIQFLASDINEDSIINIQDVILIINIILNN